MEVNGIKGKENKVTRRRKVQKDYGRSESKVKEYQRHRSIERTIQPRGRQERELPGGGGDKPKNLYASL